MVRMVRSLADRTFQLWLRLLAAQRLLLPPPLDGFDAADVVGEDEVLREARGVTARRHAADGLRELAVPARLQAYVFSNSDLERILF